jgi:hypothetical protein
VGGIQMMIDSLNLGLTNKSKSSTVITQEDKDAALKSMNGMDTDGMGNYIPDMPKELEGGEINLLRAVYTHADEVVKRIDRDLSELEKKKTYLLLDREAHEELLSVAEHFVTKLTALKSHQ